LSIPTLLLGYLTLKAQAFGLTRTFDQVGILDMALDRIKEVAASGYKQSVKMALAKTLHDYNQQMVEYYRTVVEKATGQALAQVNQVDELEKRLSEQREESGKSLLEREIRLDKAEGVLKSSEIILS
jgi:formate dehydrogenase maturation protein FdhE